MTPGERMARAERAKAAMDEYLEPAFQIVESDYGRRMMDIAAEKPWEAEKITKLAMALKISRTVRAQIDAIIADGKAAEQDHSRAAQIERIPAHKRSILGI